MVKNEILIYIDGINFSRYLQFAPKTFDSLDDSLDEGEMELTGVPAGFGEVLKVGQRIDFIYNTYEVDGNGNEIAGTRESTTKYYILEKDNTEESPVNTGALKHNITAVECTKILDGIILPNLTFTNVINKDYSGTGGKVEPTVTGDEFSPP